MEVNYNNESELPSIIQMDMDGSNRKELVRLASDEYFSFNNAIIVSDNYLYTCISKMENVDGRIKPVKRLVKISLMDGSRKDLLELNEMWDILSSVWEEKELIISHVDTKTDDVYLWRVSTEGELLESFGPYGQITLYYDSEMLITAEVISSKCIISRFDLKTGDKTGYIEVPEVPSAGLFCNQYENDIAHLMFAVMEGNLLSTREYLLDFRNSDYYEMKLEYDENGVTRKVGAISSSDDRFFVIRGFEQGRISITGTDGIPHEYDYPKYQRALILKEDYWNNRPVYRDIEDTVSVS